MFAGSFSVIRLVTTPITMIVQVMNQVAAQVGIPGVYIAFAFAALIIMVMFAIIYLIFRVRS